MDFFVPYDQLGVATPGPWQNASPASGQRGSILNALVFPAIQNEILNVQDAAGLTRNAGDFTQLLQAIKYLIPKYAPVQTAYGATANGGLAKDASNNFLLALLNLVADNRAKPVGADVIALERNADGVTVGVSASAFGAYIASLFQQNATFAQITPTNLVGLSLSPTTGGADYAIPRGVTTTVPLAAVTVSPAFGSVSNGVLTVAKAGYYVIVISGAMFISSNGHASDFGVFRFILNPGSGPNSNSQPIAPGGGQAQGNFVSTVVQHLNAGDQVYLQASANNLYGDGFNVGVSGYTNMLVALLNS